MKKIQTRKWNISSDVVRILQDSFIILTVIEAFGKDAEKLTMRIKL